MRFSFAFPDIGEGLTEGKIIQLKVKPGDIVRQGDALAIVETDKVVTEIPSPRDGVVVELAMSEGGTVRVGEMIAVIETAQDGSASVVGKLENTGDMLAPSEESGDLPPAAERPASRAKPLASPVARKLAAERGIELDGFPGSGPGGRILKKDIEQAAAKMRRPAGPEPSLQAAGSQELSTIRKAIASNMERSQGIPAAVVHDFIEVDGLVALRKELAAQAGRKIGFLPFFVKAAAIALEEHPLLNSSFTPESMTYQRNDAAHIGVAVDTEEGLVVPVIRDAARLPIIRLQEEIDGLAEKARGRRISVGELRGGTFTVSNFGVFAGTYGKPMILPPQVGILGTGRIHQAAVVRDGAIQAAHILPLSLVFDHRLIDGMYACRFLARFMDLVAKPLMILSG